MEFKNIKGSIVALITPFKEDGSVNFDALEKLVERQIEGGTAAILSLGTTGEYPTMSHEEDDEVVACTIKAVAGRVPVIVGSGSNCTATQIKKSIDYEKMGADALLLISPYYNKANEEGMYRHFIVAIKEASGNMGYAMEVAQFCGPDFAMYSGDDDINIAIYAAGGSGTISVFANLLPKESAEIAAKWFAGDTAGALEEHLHYLQLMKKLFIEVNPIPIKAAMNYMGLNAGPCRLPLAGLSEKSAAVLKAEMTKLGLI